jgi:hypothetical protein
VQLINQRYSAALLEDHAHNVTAHQLKEVVLVKYIGKEKIEIKTNCI